MEPYIMLTLLQFMFFLSLGVATATALPTWDYSFGKRDIVYLTVITNILIWALWVRVTTARKLHEARFKLHAREIASFKRDIAHLKAENGGLRRSFDHASDDYEWALGVYQDQLRRNQGTYLLCTFIHLEVLG